MASRSGYLKMNVGFCIAYAILFLGVAMVLHTVWAANITSQVIVGNAAPTVSSVVLNNNTAITLTANATTTINVSFTVSDANGCGDVFFNGNVTTTVFRSGVSSTCSVSNQNCYTVSTSTHACTGSGTSTSAINATASVDIYYFAQATDSSSSFSTNDWGAFVTVRDAANATSGASATNQELNTLTAINVTTSSINYGSVTAGTDTGATNQTATSTNAGNSSTTLQLSASATLTSGSNSISTSSQRYSTSSFTYAGTSTALTASAVTVSGFLLTSPTSTTNVQRTTFWGLTVPGGTATGTYTGTNVFGALFQP